MNHIVSTYYAGYEQTGLIQDNFNTHTCGSFNEHVPLVDAPLLSGKLVFHFTPKHGSWLNMAEIEFSVLARQCLNRRSSMTELSRQVSLWVSERNERAVKVHWSCRIATAEDKRKRWYEQVNPANETD